MTTTFYEVVQELKDHTTYEWIIRNNIIWDNRGRNTNHFPWRLTLHDELEAFFNQNGHSCLHLRNTFRFEHQIQNGLFPSSELDLERRYTLELIMKVYADQWYTILSCHKKKFHYDKYDELSENYDILYGRCEFILCYFSQKR